MTRPKSEPKPAHDMTPQRRRACKKGGRSSAAARSARKQPVEMPKLSFLSRKDA